LNGYAQGGEEILLIDPAHSNKDYAKIQADELRHCSEDSLCSFDISLNATIIGTVTVDLENEMRIVSITPVNVSGYIMKKVYGYNAIDVVRSET
jgi:hypothetical protein